MGLFGEIDEAKGMKGITIMSCTPFVEMLEANATLHRLI